MDANEVTLSTYTSGEIQQMPKIFGYTVRQDLVVGVYALAEDGSSLIIEPVDHHIQSRVALSSQLARSLYNEHYPEGYEFVDLVDYSEDELEKHEAFTAALKLNAESSPGYDEQDTPSPQPEASQGQETS